MNQQPHRVAVYVRCSTSEERQDTDVQLKELERYVQAYGWEYDAISEYGSGYKGEQPRLQEVIEKIRLGYYRTLLVHSLDRFSREHPKKTNALLDRIVYDYKCRFISLKEGIDSENEMVWCAIRPLFSYFANVYSKQLSDKIRAGIRNKKEKGLFRGGRPRKAVNLERLRSILASNGRLPLRELETRYNADLPKRERVSYQTIRTVLAAM
jgi:DNA invertase Pin-like site-specific DNA recombinase